MHFTIRPASPNDAAAAARVIAKAIRITCVADHGNDEDKIAAWLDDKSEANVEFLINDSASACFVAERTGEIIGFTAACSATLLLLYVDPDASGQGVGTALLETVERRARASGYERITLDSTKTAQRFYQRMGYADDARPGRAVCGVTCYPMAKNL